MLPAGSSPAGTPGSDASSPQPAEGAGDGMAPKRTITPGYFMAIIGGPIIWFLIYVKQTGVVREPRSVFSKFQGVCVVSTAAAVRYLAELVTFIQSSPHYTAASLIALHLLEPVFLGCLFLEDVVKLVASLCNLLPVLVNCYSVRAAIRVQNISAAGKSLIPAFIIVIDLINLAQADLIIRKVGDSVVLNPGQSFHSIRSVICKRGPYLVANWVSDNVSCYRGIKGRCSSNTTDGSLTISNLTVDDRGNYTFWINDKVLNMLELLVIKPVPKPLVSVKCNNEKTLCNLTCEANISPDVGTVEYEWRTGEEVLSNNKELIITENKESSFICMLKNPVSRSSSDGVDNPLSSGNPGAAAGLAAAIVILIVAPALAVIGRFGWYRFKNRKFPTWKEFWCCGKKKPKGGDAEAGGETVVNIFSSYLQRSTSDDHEPNGGLSTETVQIINENENSSVKPSGPETSEQGSADQDQS